MRINPNPTNDILAAIWNTQSQEQTALQQLSTGKRVNVPSDDPAAAAIEVENQATESRIDQYLQSAGSLQSMFQSADSTLNSVTTALNQAVSLGVEAGDGTLSTSNLQQIEQQVQGILQQVVQLANTSFQGTYLFAGTATTQQPFTQTASGVTYNGNDGINTVTIADGRSLQSNLPGDQIFQQPGSDVLGSLQQLASALQSGDGVSINAATNAVSGALSYLNTQRVFYGNALNQLTDDQTALSQQQTNLKAQDNTLVGADMAQAATNLSQAATANQAALAAAAQVLPMTLLDYLK
ncbi:MAG TPA: flagellar hook-associated protein FlgL [Terriglobales bacterium]|nr:flagellar hook-associated protein FlgL [Terriglobales bacterium]